MLLSVLSTSLMFAIVKYLNGFSVYQIIFFRAVVTLSFTIPLMLKNNLNIFGNNKKILSLRGLLGLISMIFFFQSMKYLDLGISVSIRYSSPVFAAIFALVLLKEKILPFNWLLLMISTASVFMIKLFGLEIDSIGFLFALLSAISLGLVFVITKKIENEKNISNWRPRLYWFPCSCRITKQWI
jgi:drug/metabolite transporter (DMT)-like permease